MPIFNYRRVPYAEIRAFSVHILTASGAFFAFLALVAAGDGHFGAMFWWLGAALLVDGVDGPIARKLDVKSVLPTWSGVMLDNVIDYVTYVLIPAYGFYESGMLGNTWSFVAAGLIVMSSAIYYADTGMKTEENFFSGFPVAWNMVVFTFFVVDPTPAVAWITILLSVVFTFLNVFFLHPVRVERLRPLNLGVFALWSVLSVFALFLNFDSPRWLVWAVVAAGAYLYFIGPVLQFFPNLGRRGSA
ncbi:phosphatidylcholine synthase [Pararhizobium mangrovi]|uniref:Phosphatidylcholine synthase n=1 Tax=Pararhizobium mangrovi TaxID=2590452 RepID=A0A506U1H1_9HYPH|nr:phosphatidylcholine/phosphatidylserine synthase [Pararhizobium mangrovi]TPW26785.1 phosphatidylcholine/phosphatidylserine synthase [Pararhizobium mangrovi]